MKKRFALILSVVMILSTFSACGSNTDDTSSAEVPTSAVYDT